LGGGHRDDVPPDVTRGEVVVVVGASVVVVVVVVGAVVVAVVAPDPPPVEPLSVEVVVVVEVDVEVEVEVPVVGVVAAGEALDPGCSLATTTPMTAEAPVALSTTARVNRRSRRCARPRSSGVCPATEPDIGTSFSNAPIRTP
jgi:hypothetical protein